MQQGVPHDAADKKKLLPGPGKHLRQVRGKRSLRGRQLLQN
jgi:hypothetical protein